MRNRCSFLKKFVVKTLIVAMTSGLALPPQGWAMLAPADAREAAAGDVNDTRAQDLKTVQAALESQMIRQRLADFKLTPEEVDARLKQLSASQVHEAALQINALNPAGDATGIVVLVLLVVLIVYLVRRI